MQTEFLPVSEKTDGDGQRVDDDEFSFFSLCRCCLFTLSKRRAMLKRLTDWGLSADAALDDDGGRQDEIYHRAIRRRRF